MDCAVRRDSSSEYDLILPPPLAREGDYVRVTGKIINQRYGRGLTNATICKSGLILLYMLLTPMQYAVVQRWIFSDTGNW